MTRNLKTLALALLAALALSAVTASAASAVNDVFRSNSGNGKTDLTSSSASPELESATLGAKIACKKGTYAGTVEGNSVTQATVHPTYEECEIPGLGSITADTHGCDYIVTGTTHTESPGGTHATVHLECTTGKSITFTAGILTLHIAPQTPKTGVVFVNTNTAESAVGLETVTAKATVTGIVTTCTPPGEFCFLLGNNGNANDLVYTDDAITTGYEDVGTFHADSNHTWTGTHGKQVHIWTETGV